MMATAEASSSYASTPFRHIKRLCESVYLLHEPVEHKVEVEVVFIHGLQLVGNSEKAYVTTWLARGGAGDNCWPSTWLVGEFPNARILSISYDANAFKSATQGRMDSYLLGEKLVQEMVFDEVCIGQHGCPVVFVCHSLGGLIAKQIIVSGHRLLFGNGKIGQLLCNVKAFFFYATPHRGSELAKLAKHIPFLPTSSLVRELEFMNNDTARLNEEFENLNHGWKIYVVGEEHATSKGPFSMVIVNEASARYGPNYICVEANHFDVCKPKSEVDTSFLYLLGCIRKVVAENSSSLLELPDFQVEMKDRMKTLQSKLKVNSIVGLVGMGGIGKTTLSKYFFNEEKMHYKRCCFLEDVKSREEMRSFQEQLFDDLCGPKRDGNKNIREMLQDIRHCVSMMKVLVVVDDVGTLENLKALQVVAFKDVRNGSKMIVTSRELDNMSEYMRDDGIMEVEEIGEVQAMELFSSYAFDGIGSDVKAQLHDQAIEIVKACGGLPLSLEVIGQYLRKLNRIPKPVQSRLKDWEQTLRRLNSAEPLEGTATNDKLWKKLRISYDSLLEGEKRLFLDFACILWQSPSANMIMRIWDSSLELQNLKNCSLIKLGADKKNLVMHEHLRSMGQKIVREVSGGDDWYDLSRLWTQEKIEELEADEHMGSKKLEGLVRNNKFEITTYLHSKEEFHDSRAGRKKNESFSKLRLLNLEGNELDVVNFYLLKCSKALKWLCINNTNVTHQSIEMIRPLKGLCVLQMVSCVELETLPRAISNLSCLRELDLECCTKIHDLPESIGSLQHLEKLNLSMCKSLKSLPNSVGDLLHLEELMLQLCANLKSLPETIGKVKLRVLDLYGCLNLRSLPNSVGDLLHLEKLRLMWCENLESLPETIGKLKLPVLDLFGCKSLKSLPDCVCDLLHLEELRLMSCENLESLPETIGKLKLRVLDLYRCKSLKSLPDSVGDLLHLEELKLMSCENLESLPETIGKLKLRVLDLYGCKSLKSLPNSVGDLLHLEELKLKSCENLETLPETIGKLKLRVLKLNGCKSLKSLPNSVGDLLHLEELKLKSCENLETLPETIGKLKLPVLDLFGCKSLKSLPDSVGDLLHLEELKLWYCVTLETLPETIGKLKIRVLDLYGCKSLKSLPNSVGDLLHLKELKLMSGENFETLLETIGKLKIRVLNLYGCKSLKSLPDSVCDLLHLEELSLSYCANLESLPETIGKLKLLVLDLCGCKSLKSLPDSVGDLLHLEELKLMYCENLETLPETIGKLKLRVLDLYWCKSLKSLPDSVGDLLHLEELKLMYCENLESLPETIGKLKLRVLDLYGCKSLKSLPDSVGDLLHLEELKLMFCENLESLPETIGKLKLRVLKLNGCKSLKSLPDSGW